MNNPETADNAPEQWRAQCLVARIQRDAAIDQIEILKKQLEAAKAYKKRIKTENDNLRQQLNKLTK